MKALTFQHQKPDCILVLQGNMPCVEFFSFFPDSVVIAADGAASDLLEIGIKPNVVIGDMDSFDVSRVKDGSCLVILTKIKRIMILKRLYYSVWIKGTLIL